MARRDQLDSQLNDELSGSSSARELDKERSQRVHWQGRCELREAELRRAGKSHTHILPICHTPLFPPAVSLPVFSRHVSPAVFSYLSPP